MIRLRLILLVLFFAFTSLSNAQDSDQIRHLLDNERYVSAEKILEEKISKDADTPELNYLLVQTYLKQDKPDAAKNFVEQKKLADLQDNQDPMNRIAYARYLIGAGQPQKAKQIFDELLSEKKARKNIPLLMAIAEAYVTSEKGDAKEALNILDLAESRDKKNAKIHLMKGNAYRKLHDGSNAYVSFQTVLKYDPDNVEAHYQLGRIFVTQKNEDLYMEHYMKAYAADSTFAPLLDALYDHYYFKDLNKAKAFLASYIRHSDYSIRNDYRMADLFYLTKEYEKAIILAKEILEKEKEKVQPRLYKLIAYSYAESGNKEEAFKYLKEYFAKEDPKNFVSRDFEFRGKLQLNENNKGEAVESFVLAFKMDTTGERKTEYAVQIADLYGQLENYASQAVWLGRVYDLKKDDRTNVDLFNWGLAYYKAGDFVMADSVFGRYTEKYPENIYGYYWRAQVNAGIDTSLALGLAIPYYKKVIELGEKDKEANKPMLLKAYGYLGGYDANITKDFQLSLIWFEKFLALDPENADANHYAEILRKWINDDKEKETNADNPDNEMNKEEVQNN